MLSADFSRTASSGAALSPPPGAPATSCPSTEELLAFHLGGLRQTGQERVEDHLEGCTECQERVRMLDPVTDPVLAALPGPGMALRGSTPLPGTPGDTTKCGLPNLFGPAESPKEVGRLRHYRVLRLLGRGGMGLVFEAVDTRLGRPVALKLLSPEAVASAENRQRFLREAQALAAVRDTDHIVAVYEADQEGETPFLAMELLRGQPLDHWLTARGRASVPDVVRLGKEIALGLAAAHGSGVIHRDIKPSNLWVEAQTGRVKILDFGLARAAEGKANVTQTGVVVGTPAYLSPEQARGDPLDARSDLFSLGCVLYELCTGRQPFQGNGALALLTALVAGTPPPIHSLNPDVPPALAALITAMLAKEPADRPASAREVAERLEALARPQPAQGPRRRFRAWAGAALLLGAVTGAAFYQVYRVETSLGVVEIRSEDPKVRVLIEQKGEVVEILDPESKQRVELRAGSYRVKLGEGAQAVQLEVREFTLRRGGKVIVTVRRLPAPPAQVGGPAKGAAAVAAKEAALAPATPPLDPTRAVLLGPRAHLSGHGEIIRGLAFSPRGDLLASSCSDGKVRLWDVATGKPGVVLQDDPAPQPREMFAAAFAPDGKTLAAVSPTEGETRVRLWDVGTGKEVGGLSGHKAAIFDAAFSRGGILATGGWDCSVRLWDVAARRELAVLPRPHPSFVRGVAFSPDGKSLASGGNGALRLWDVAARSEKWSREYNLAPLAFAPDGRRLAGSEWRAGTVAVVDAASGKMLACWKAHEGEINWVAFSPDGGFLASAGADEKVRLWRVTDQMQVAVLSGHKGKVYSLAFAPDGKTLASGGEADGTVLLWDVASVIGKRSGLGTTEKE